MSTSETEPEPAHAEAEPARSTPQLSLLLELQEADLALDRLAYRRRELAERVAVSELGVEARRADRPRRRGSRPARQARLAAADPRPAFRSGRWANRDHRAAAALRARRLVPRRAGDGRGGGVARPSSPGDRGPGARGHGGTRATGPGAGRSEGELLPRRPRSWLWPASSSAWQRPRSTRRRLWSARLGIELAARVAPELAASYERLRAKLGGIGAAHLVGGACSGCHLQLPAGELHRLRHATPDSVVYCDQCGRILVPDERPGRPASSDARSRSPRPERGHAAGLLGGRTDSPLTDMG